MQKLKAVLLPFNTITAILEHADIPAQAPEVIPGDDSPVSRPRQLLPAAINTALREAHSRPLVSGGLQMLAGRPDDAATLTFWLRALADRLGTVDGAQFRDAADIIEAAP